MFRIQLIILVFAVALNAEEVVLPVSGGDILVSNIQLGKDQFNIQSLMFTLTNRTPHTWGRMEMRFDIGALCPEYKERQHYIQKQFTIPFSSNEGLSPSLDGRPRPKDFHVWHPGRSADAKGCTAEIVEVYLLSASGLSADGSPQVVKVEAPPPTNFDSRLQELNVKREEEYARRVEQEEADAIAQDEADRKAAAAQKSRAAAESARRKRAAADEAARAVEERRRLSEERRRLTEVCSAVRSKTIDKKISDLTVREEEQVRACQRLGLY